MFLTLKISKTPETFYLHVSIFVVIFRGVNRALLGVFKTPFHDSKFCYQDFRLSRLRRHLVYKKKTPHPPELIPKNVFANVWDEIGIV